MGVVGGSRHYGGPADLGGGVCPSCGAENAGPLAQGCVSCGAGRPGHRAEGEAHRPATARVEDARPPLPQPPLPTTEPSVFEQWMHMHPQATLEEAFTA